MTFAKPYNMNLAADFATPLLVVDVLPVERAGVIDKLFRMLLGDAPSSGFALGQLDTVAGNAEFDRMARRYGRLA